MNRISLISFISVCLILVVINTNSNVVNAFTSNGGGLLIVDTNQKQQQQPKLRMMEEQGKRALISPSNLISSTTTTINNSTNMMIKNYSRMRGVSANCEYDNSNSNIKKFKCSFGIVKKILSQNINMKAEMILSVNLNEHNANVLLLTNNEILYQNTFTLGDAIPSICADIFFRVGLCLRINNVYFHTQSPQCFKLNLQVYLQAITFEEVILSEPIGYNANLC